MCDESDLRLSGSGLLAGIALVGGGLAGAAGLLRPWERPAGPETLVTAGAWWTAAALTGWVALSVRYWLRAPYAPRRRRFGRLTVPGSRRLAEALLLAGTMACSPASPDSAPPRIEILGTVGSGTTASSTLVTGDPPVSRVPNQAAPASSANPSIPAPSRSGTHDAPERSPLLAWLEAGGGVGDQDPTAPAPAAEPRTHVVERGEHFWSIAGAEVEEHLGRRASDAEISDYWVGLVRANRYRIRSGDPDLIHPGEILELPPLPPAAEIDR